MFSAQVFMRLMELLARILKPSADFMTPGRSDYLPRTRANIAWVAREPAGNEYVNIPIEPTVSTASAD
jgi:hypothetical protein